MDRGERLGRRADERGGIGRREGGEWTGVRDGGRGLVWQENKRPRRSVVKVKKNCWWSRSDSNRPPQQCECCALPDELRPRIYYYIISACKNTNFMV